MQAGFAEREITPMAGMEQPGGYGKAYHSTVVHDPPKVRAAVFADASERVAVVGCDVAMLPRYVVLRARAAIEARCGIRAQSIMLAASHTHSGGPIGMVAPGAFDHASELVRRLAYEHSTCDDPRYVAMVQEAIVDAVIEADAGKRDAVAAVGVGREAGVAFNRRLRMRNGRTYTHPGKGNPDIVGFAGPVDPDVGVIGVWSRESGAAELLGCVVNFACHGTTGPGGASADWVYYLERTTRGVLGPQAVVVFLNGASGDVTQVNNLSPHGEEHGERAARRVGVRVGAEALKVLVSAPAGALEPLASRVEVLAVPRRRPSAERVRRSLELLHSAAPGSTEWLFAKEVLMLDALLQKEPVAEVEVQAIQIGPVVLVGNPSELFCQWGLDIKAASPFPFTFVVELANGSVGYAPTEDAFGPHGGGYETRLTSYSNLEVGAGAKIVAAANRLTRALTPGVEPSLPRSQAWLDEWDYGNVPPEVE